MKTYMKEKFKYSKGITIISLVITIIVMIIIATISINMGLSSINSTQDSAIETNLEIVQQAITQQYSKAMTLDNLDIESNINLNSGTGDAANQPNSFIGTPLKKDELKKYIDKIPQAPDLINVDNTYNYDDTNYEDIYYLISDNELEELGIDVGSGQEYIVNYSTGEVLDVTNKSYANGEPAYINSFTTILDIEKEDFIDTPINIAIHEELKRTHEGYEFSIKVTDEIAKITPAGIADGKIPTQSDIEKDTDDLNKNDVITENIVIIGKDPDNPITDGVSIVKKVVPDSSQGIGEHYIYEFIIDESKVDPTNPTIKIEILPDSVIDDGENGNALAELTTSDNRENEPGDIDFYLDNIKYYAKNEKGEQISGVTLGDEVWGSSATVDITLSTTEKRGLNNDSYIFNYVWSTTDTPNWEDAKQFSLNPRQGVKSVKTTITIEGYTGKGKLYVKPSTQFETAIGTAFDPNRIKSIDLNLDCTPPTYKVEYKAENGTWRPLEEYLDDPNGYFIMSEPISPGNVSAIEISPKLKVTTMDSDAGLPQESISGNSVSGYYTYGIHTEDDLEQISYEAEDRKIGDVGTIAHYSECFEAGWYPMEVKNGKVSEFPNELEFLASHNIKKEGSGEYILVCSKTWGYDGAYFIDCLGNKLEGNALYNNLKIDYFAPEVSKIELFEEGYGEFYITDDYSGIKLDKTKIKYAWIEDSSVPSNVQWKTITDEEIKQKQQPTKGGAYKRIGFKVDVPEVAANYYLAVKLDDLEDIAGNKINTEIVSEENILKEVFEYEIENLVIEAENFKGETIEGVEIDNEIWGKRASFNICLSTTSSSGLKKGSYIFEYIWTTDENYQWNSSETQKASIYLPTNGRTEGVTSTITLDSYTGKGYLYVRPMNSYTSVSGTVLNSAPKKIKINLDSTSPEFYLKYKNNQGVYEDISKHVADNNHFFKKGDFVTPPSKQYTYFNPNIIEGIKDNGSGISKSLSVGNVLKETEECDELFALYDKEEIIEEIALDIDFHGLMGKDLGTARERDGAILASRLKDSGEYYYILRNTSKIYGDVIDNVGNKVLESYIGGPIKIDLNAPKVVDVYSDDLGKAVIQIEDDYSGLTKDYSRIKYAWVKNRNETPTEWKDKFSNITEDNYTSLNNPKTIYATVELPKFYEDLYLVVKIEGYKDIAGNEANSDLFVSDETFCLAKDFKIEIFETDEIEKVKPIQIRITSESGKLFRIQSISYEHKGLNDKHKIKMGNMGMDYVEVFTEYNTTYNSTVNGPIIVSVVDGGGNVYTQEYTVKNVQGLILNYDISEKELWLPIWRYTEYLTEIDDQLIYVNWDKLNNVEEGKYVVQNLFNIEDVEVTKNDETYERREITFNPVEKVARHEYSDTGWKQIEITGVLENVYFNYDYKEIEIEHANCALTDIFTDKSVEDIKYFYDKIELSRNSLKEIVQFGWQIGGTNGINNYSGNSQKNFYNCINLKTLPVVDAENVEKDLNVKVFKDITKMYFTFAGSGISSFDPNFFAKAENLHTLHGTFDKCKSLTSINENLLSNCPNLKICQETFRESALGSVPEKLFWNNEFLENVQAVFDQTPLTAIPSLLFRWNPNLKNASYAFKMTLIDSIPPNLFEWNGALSDASYIFQHTEKLKEIPEVLFQKNEALTTVRAAFEGSINVTSIPPTLFINNILLDDVGYTFKKTNISVIPENIFKLRDEIDSKITTVEGTFSYTKIEKVSNNVVLPIKGSVENCSVLFEGCEKLKIDDNAELFKGFSKVKTFHGVFSVCSALDVIPQDLFAGCSSVESFSYAFHRTAITKVERSVIFGDAACKNTVVDVSGMFAVCSKLGWVDNLFEDFIELKKANSLFRADGNLKSVGIDGKTFKGCEKLVHIGGMFCGCRNLEIFGKDSFNESLSTIKLLSDILYEVKTENGIKYIRNMWCGIFQDCEKLAKDQTPQLFDIPFVVPAKTTDYNPQTDYINYNSYVNCGFEIDFDFEGAKYYEEEWRFDSYVEE